MKDLEIYVHVPFCKKKCLYCDFFSGAFSEDAKRTYFENLIQEIKESPYSDRGFSVSSVFFGGGTPSSVDPSYLEAVLSELRKRFLIQNDAEISMECNPGAVSCDLARYREMGFNRLSIGLQAVQNDLLKRLGRIHTYEEFLKTYEAARQAGFNNINVDLMSGLPGQTIEDWETGIRTVAALNPEHISAYSLIIAENTPFYDMYEAQEMAREKGCYGDENDSTAPQSRNSMETLMESTESTESMRNLPTEEEDRLMYERTEEILSEFGYHRYEISNYARAGKECRHNVGYWTHVPYLGFGAAAASFVPESALTQLYEELPGSISTWLRFKNPEKLDYLAGPYEEQEVLTKEDLMGEFMMLGLRMTQGVSEERFKCRFGVPMESIYQKEIKRFLKEGLLEKTEESKETFLRLTKRGLDVANLVFEAFLT